jgi:hypothetical protein
MFLKDERLFIFKKEKGKKKKGKKKKEKRKKNERILCAEPNSP